jgi:hypothetical protein
LRDIIYCETSLIGYDSIIQENHIAIGKLCVARSLPPPPSKPIPPEENVASKGSKQIKAATKAGIATASLFTPAAPIGIIALGVQAYGLGKEKKKAEAAYEQELKLYNQHLVEHEKQMLHHQDILDDEEMRMSTEAAQKKLYESQSDRINELISHARTTLAALYETNILHVKYQNFVATASIYDYLSTGRTASLIRVDNDPGAYNLFEDDLRFGRVVKAIGMVGSQIVGAVRGLASEMRSLNISICDAVEKAGEMQRASSAEVIAGISNLNKTAEMNRLNSEISNNHLEKISEFSKIQTHALREWSPWGGRRVSDKSGYPVD